MPFSVADQDISGTGQIDFGAVRNLLFWSAHIAQRGDLVHEVNLPSGQLYRVGWVSLGDHFAVGGVSDRFYWREPTWLFFDENLWTPVLTTPGAPPPTLLASGIRWYLTPNTLGRLFVLADS